MTRARNLANLGNKNAITADIGLFNIGIGSTQPTNYKLDVVGGNAYIGGGVTITGNLSVGGTVTYEDVTNVDSVGIITAAKGFRATAGGLQVSAGIVTFTDTGTSTYGVDIVNSSAGSSGLRIKAGNADGQYSLLVEDKDGTNLFEVMAGGGGANLRSGSLYIPDKIIHYGDTNTAIRFPAADTITAETGGSERLRISSNGRVGVGTASPRAFLDLYGAAENATLLLESNDANSNLCLMDDSGSARFLNFGGALALRTGGTGAFTGDNEALRVDGSGRVLISSDTSRSVWGANPLAQIEALDSTAALSLVRNSNNTAGPWIALCKSRGTADGAVTIIQDGDSLGSIDWFGADGGDLANVSAEIKAEIDGTPGSNDLPGRIIFKTTADGAGSPTERLRITSDGKIGVNVASPTMNGNEQGIHIYAADYPTLHLTNSTTGSTASDGSILTLNDDGSLILRNDEDKPIRFETNSLERFRMSRGANGVATLLGGGVTNNQNKYTAYTCNHYTFNTYNQIDLIKGTSTSGVNKIEIGGSDSSAGCTAATEIRLYTAANATTNNGTARLTIGTAGITTVHGTLHTDTAYSAIGARITGGGSGYSSPLVVRTANGVTRLEVDGGVGIHTGGNVSASTFVPYQGQLGGRRNLIINGSMKIFQRYASAGGSGDFAADRWKVGFQWTGSNTVTMTANQDVTGPDVAYEMGLRKYIRVGSNGSAGDLANDYIQIEQSIEAQNIANSGWNYNSVNSYITCSFFARATVGYGGRFMLMTHDGTVKIWAQTFTMTTAWQRYTFTVPGHADLTFNNDTGNGLRVFFIPYYGTTYTASGATLGQWNTYSSGNYMTDMSNQVAASSTYTDITGVQIEVATAATPFEHRLYQDDLRDCQRYYFEYGVESQPVTNSINNNAARLPMSEYPVKMRATPTLTTTNTLTEFSSGSTHTVSAFYNQAANGAGYIQLGGNTTNGVYMKFKANAEL